MENRTPCPSEFALERWRLGELAGLPDEAALVDHIKECQACSAKQTELSRESVPSPLDLDAVWAKGRGDAPAWPRIRRWRLGAAALAGAALAVVLWVRHPSTDTLTKGSAWHLGLVAKTKAGAVVRLDPGAPLGPGDRLRFEVFTPWPKAEVVLIMLDSAGTVTPLAPAGERATTIAGGRQVLLDEAVELDAQPGPERIVLIGCHEPMRVADVLAAGKRAMAEAHGDARLVKTLGTGCHEESFWISKVKP